MNPDSETRRVADASGEASLMLDSVTPVAAARIGALSISGESVDRLGDALLLVGPNGTLLDANTIALEMYGYSHEELLAMRVNDLLAPQGLDDFDNLLDWSDDRPPGRTRHAHRDGTPLPVAVRSLPVLVERGDAASLMFVRTADDASRSWPKTALAEAVVDTTRHRAVGEVLEGRTVIEGMAYAFAEAMGRAVETRDPYTRGHEARVATFARLVAEEMALSEDEIAGAEIAGAVHDIGKIGVPAEILSKPGILSQWEIEMIRQHPTVGYEILKDIAFPWPVADAVLQHHERMDGSGYPHGLNGDEISLTARILAVADAVEAMASDRPYRVALGIDAAIGELLGRPHAYDSTVVEACLRLHLSGRIAW